MSKLLSRSQSSDCSIKMSRALIQQFTNYFESVWLFLSNRENHIYYANAEEALSKLPASLCGVYAIFANDIPVYVGKSKNIKRRLSAHLVKEQKLKSKFKEIFNALRSNQRITFAYALIEPLLYSSLEESLMERAKFECAKLGERQDVNPRSKYWGNRSG